MRPLARLPRRLGYDPAVGGLGGLDANTIDCADPLRVARFWAAVFGTDVGACDGEGPHYVDLLPAPGVPTLRFQRVPEPKRAKNRLHLDVSVDDLDEGSARAEPLALAGYPGSRSRSTATTGS